MTVEDGDYKNIFASLDKLKRRYLSMAREIDKVVAKKRKVEERNTFLERELVALTTNPEIKAVMDRLKHEEKKAIEAFQEEQKKLATNTNTDK